MLPPRGEISTRICYTSAVDEGEDRSFLVCGGVAFCFWEVRIFFFSFESYYGVVRNVSGSGYTLILVEVEREFTVRLLSLFFFS